MPRVCTVCSHPERKAIDTGIVSRVPNREIALGHGLTEMAVSRHSRSHLPEKLAKATEAAEIAEADSALASIRYYLRRVRGLLDKAEERGSLVAAVAAAGEARQLLTLIAKVTHELDERPQTNVLITSPDWLAVQAKLMDALRPYPDAMEAVRRALGGEAKVVAG